MDWHFPYRSQRMPVLGDNLVVSSQPLAARAGLRMLEEGGNAVDAALAAALTLPVVEPVMNGLGGDTQVLLWTGKAVEGLNSSGRAPRAWTPARFAGHARMPTEGWDAVTVPGTVSAWIALWRRHGRLPLARLVAPALHYAREGFPVSPIIARQWAAQVPRLKAQPGFAEAFLPGGRPPAAGERFRFPDIADTLEHIVDSEGNDFYRGRLAACLVDHAARHGGAMTAQDLAAHEAQWVAPSVSGYRDIELHELPPNTQGLAVQIALGILEFFDLGPSADPLQRAHLQIEAMKIAFADVYGHVCEPDAMRFDPARLLDGDYLESRARGIDPKRAGAPTACDVPSQSTVYLAAADRDGMLVSLIQSNFQGFGSGIVVPGTGISLHNRGSGFSLEDGHPNQVGGGKRPFHTIIPALLRRNGQPLAALGVVGANMQPQGQVQVICALADLRLNPQSALDMPRWRIDDAGRLRLEAEFDPAVAQGLRDLGHPVDVRPAGELEFGGAQLIWRLDEGYAGASDPRRDGSAVAF